MKLKVLGSGCSNCVRLEKNVRQAVNELGINAEIELVKEIQDIMVFGVMSTPALVVNEQVKFTGRVPSPEEIKKYLN